MMKQIMSLLGGIVLVLASVLLQSCSDEYDPGILTLHDIVESHYSNNFVDRYGMVDPTHTWGFEMMAPVSYGNAATRASESNVSVNVNQWCERDPNQKIYKDNALISTIQVPGWPNFDGLYYTNAGKLNEAEMFTNKDAQPIGDITDYEIQYVSHFFRTHKKDQDDQLHLSDFFIQNVSQDKDQVVYENTPFNYPTNYNGEKSFNGANVTDVNSALASGCTNITKKKETSNENINYSLDYLHFKAIGGSEQPSNSVNDGWTHVNNFNSGNSNQNPEESATTNNREIKYVYSSGTEDFACRPSMGTDGVWVRNYWLKRLTWVENGVQREGWYLAFDFATETADTKVNYDGYYSNWIVKITPAYLSETTKATRVMCEDLGNTFDFDFNDVVFDVYFESYYNNATNSNQCDAVVTVQAAGGTMPIYIENTGSDYEIHHLLGNAATTPVNVGAGTNHEVAIFRIPGFTPYQNHSADDIKIYVENNNKLEAIASAKENLQTSPSMRGDNIAPQKFAVPTVVRWMQECKFIEYGYSHFPDWVKDHNYTYNGKQWYEVVSNPGLLY